MLLYFPTVLLAFLIMSVLVVTFIYWIQGRNLKTRARRIITILFGVFAYATAPLLQFHLSNFLLQVPYEAARLAHQVGIASSLLVIIILLLGVMRRLAVAGRAS